MKHTFWSQLYFYHKKYSWLYLILIVLVYAVYYFQLPTPLRLLLSPFGLQFWSAGLTRASVKLMQLDFVGAYDQNPLIYLVVVGINFQLFVMPFLEKKEVCAGK